MSRPSSIADLSDHQREGHLLLKIYADKIIDRPHIGQHIMAALSEAQMQGLEIGGGEVRVPLSQDELAANLRTAQESWDRGKSLYEKVLEDPHSIEKWQRYTVNSWAIDEDMPAIEWPADEPANT